MLKLQKPVVILVLATLSLGSFAVAYKTQVINNSKENEESKQSTIKAEANLKDTYEEEQKEVSEEEPINITASNLEDKITPKTKIVYEYAYDGSEKITSTEEMAPYFMIDMSRDEIIKMFSGWQVLSFSPQEVVLRKNKKTKEAAYIIGVFDGFIGVYYRDGAGISNLKEILDTPVSSLSSEEQEKLKKGIPVSNEKELMRILEDYSS